MTLKKQKTHNIADLDDCELVVGNVNVDDIYQDASGSTFISKQTTDPISPTKDNVRLLHNASERKGPASPGLDDNLPDISMASITMGMSEDGGLQPGSSNKTT